MWVVVAVGIDDVVVVAAIDAEFAVFVVVVALLVVAIAVVGVAHPFFQGYMYISSF